MGTEAFRLKVMEREWDLLVERAESWQRARDRAAAALGDPPPFALVEVVEALRERYSGLPAPVSQLHPEFVELRWIRDPLVFVVEFQKREGGTEEDALFARLHPFWFFRNRRTGVMEGGGELFGPAMDAALGRLLLLERTP